MCEGRTGNVGVGEDGEMNSNSGSPLSPVGRRWRLPGFMRAYNTTPIVPNTVSGIVSTDSVIKWFRLVGRPRLRLVITSEVGETQLREAVSKRTKISAT